MTLLNIHIRTRATVSVRNGSFSVGSNTSYIETEDAIIISSKSDFELWSSSGNGTEENPYMIDGFNITSVVPALVFENTSYHFILRNCSFVGDGFHDMYLLNYFFSVSSQEAIVVLDNVSNGKIVNCSTSNTSVGIALHNSEYCRVMNSSITLSGCGILLENSTSCVVRNSDISDSFYGIGLQETASSQVCENTLLNCTQSAIYVSQTTACGIINNKMTSGGIEFARFDENPLRYFEHEIEGNEVGGRKILYLRENHKRVLACSNYSQIIIVDSESITLRDGDFKNVSTAALLAFSPGCSVIDSVISYSHSGVWIHESDNCSVKNTATQSCGVAVEVTTSESFTASENQFSACNQGFSLVNGSDCTISMNDLDLVPGVLRASGIWAYYSTGLSALNNSMHLDRNLTNNQMSLQNLETKSNWAGGGSNKIDPFIPKLTPVPYYRSGVAIHGMNEVSICRNNISGFSYGVHMVNCNSSTIAQNQFREIMQSCITLLPSCTNNFIYGNSFTADRIPLAVDYGIENTWYNSTTGGNYWSNYGGWGPYLVGGDASSIDWYPNGQNAFLHVFISAVVVVGLFIVVLIRAKNA
ncbi:MAG: hypothetical protein GF309_08440 [Candidatus Lokiarchaeota archaeon]|nr:hypothetical protein [Candidatus Lokiarchaeota archaeon]